jgi:very-short-patch-repair endonuclease
MGVDLVCGYCGNDFSISNGEYNRQTKNGRTVFYCGLSCAAKKRNAERPDKRILIEKLCLHCNSPFSTFTGSKSADFCSRSCASAGSVTDKRRNAQRKSGIEHCKNLIPIEDTLRLREMWKYKKLKSFLEFSNEKFEFEFIIGDYVFDLALPERMIFIEFDGIYHNGKQLLIDADKDKFAQNNGWKVIRKKVQGNTVMDSDLLYDILK